jgi:hypothetical protein
MRPMISDLATSAALTTNRGQIGDVSRVRLVNDVTVQKASLHSWDNSLGRLKAVNPCPRSES